MTLISNYGKNHYLCARNILTGIFLFGIFKNLSVEKNFYGHSNQLMPWNTSFLLH